MQGCHYKARRAKANSPAIDRWVRALIVSSPGRDERTTASLGGHRHAATKVAQPSRLRVLAPSHRHPQHPPNNVQQPRKYHFYHHETVKNIHAIHPSSFILHNSAKTPVISHLSLQNRHEPTPKTPAQQLAANPFPGRTRALACFRPRLAVGTDARHRASVSRTPDIVILLKNARNNTLYATKPPPNLAPALQPDRHRPSYRGGLSSAAIHPFVIGALTFFRHLTFVIRHS